MAVTRRYSPFTEAKMREAQSHGYWRQGDLTSNLIPLLTALGTLDSDFFYWVSAFSPVKWVITISFWHRHEDSMNSTDLKSDSLGSVCHSPSTYYLSKLLHRAYVWNGYGPQSVGLLWSLDMVAPINPLRRLPDTCSQRLRGIVINQLPWQLVKPNKWVEITKASWLS